VAPVFFAFRLMVALGLAMIALGVFGVWLLWRGKMEQARWYLRLLSACWPVGFVALISGWIVTEVGRQPWIAYGVLRTADAASPVGAPQVLLSLVLFFVVYCVVFSVGIWYVSRMIHKGPQASLPGPDTLPNRPLAGGQTETREAVPS
jgi:cytochrome d ubiquinol oxidase subunit I